MKAALFPQEIETWYVIPTIRKELSIAMVKLGKTQKEVAKILNITEPTVSNYINSKRGQFIEFDERAESIIKKAAENLNKNSSKEEMIAEIMKISEYIKESKLLCQIHKKYANISDTCNACY